MLLKTNLTSMWDEFCPFYVMLYNPRALSCHRAAGGHFSSLSEQLTSNTSAFLGRLIWLCLRDLNQELHFERPALVWLSPIVIPLLLAKHYLLGVILMLRVHDIIVMLLMRPDHFSFLIKDLQKLLVIYFFMLYPNIAQQHLAISV